jgi:hypothetical protein
MLTLSLRTNELTPAQAPAPAAAHGPVWLASLLRRFAGTRFARWTSRSTVASGPRPTQRPDAETLPWRH